MTSALSGSGALPLLTVFERGKATGGRQEARSAQEPLSEGQDLAEGSDFAGMFVRESTEKLIAGLDRNGDGAVDMAELTQAFARTPTRVRPDLTQVMADLVTSLDGDGRASVSASALSRGLSQLAHGAVRGDPPQVLARMSPAEKAARLIDALDVDGDRAIDAQELQAALDAKAKQDKSLQELVFDLLLGQKAQDRIDEAASPDAA